MTGPDHLDAWDKWAASLERDVFIDRARCRRMAAEECDRAIDEYLRTMTRFVTYCAASALGIKAPEEEKEKGPT